MKIKAIYPSIFTPLCNRSAAREKLQRRQQQNKIKKAELPAGNTEVALEQERMETPDKIKNTRISTVYDNFYPLLSIT